MLPIKAPLYDRHELLPHIHLVSFHPLRHRPCQRIEVALHAASMGGATNLPPGFHFFPSDEDLVVHFLRRKVANLPCRPDIVPTILLHRYDPWELNGLHSQPSLYCYAW